MITTNISYSVPHYFATKETRLYNWRCVDLESNGCYFFVEYQLEDGGNSFSVRKLVASGEDMREICKDISANAGMTLLQVAMLSPPWINNTERWEFVNLTEIAKNSSQDEGLEKALYIAEDGRRFADPFSLYDELESAEVNSALSTLKRAN